MAASAACYKRFLTLLENWPIDKTKTGRLVTSYFSEFNLLAIFVSSRDIGEYLRETIVKAYKDNKFESNLVYWDKQYLALQKIINNEYRDKYPRTLTSSATGLTREQCNIALSNDFLEELQKEETSLLKKLFSTKSSS